MSRIFEGVDMIEEELTERASQALIAIKEKSAEMAARLVRAADILAIIDVNIRYQLERPASEDRAFILALAKVDFAHHLKTGEWRDKESDND